MVIEQSAYIHAKSLCKRARYFLQFKAHARHSLVECPWWSISDDVMMNRTLFAKGEIKERVKHTWQIKIIASVKFEGTYRLFGSPVQWSSHSVLVCFHFTLASHTLSELDDLSVLSCVLSSVVQGRLNGILTDLSYSYKSQCQCQSVSRQED